MNRRAFIKAVGATAAATTVFGLPSLPSAPCAAPTVTSGWTSGTFHAGDVFTIAGQYAINPLTGAPTSYLQQFMVTDTVTADSPDTDVQIHPRIIVGPTVKAQKIDMRLWASDIMAPA